MSKRILVIGDSCRDVFVYCSASRLCPDVPVPVLNILSKTENPGMAKNLQRNIASLNVHCDIVTNANWQAYTKTRYMHNESNHMFMRVDSGEEGVSRYDVNKLCLDYDLIAISDYDKGFLKEEDVEYICSNHKNVFLDSKKRLGEWADNCKYIKINEEEFDRSKNTMPKNLFNKTIYTKGSQGCFFNGENFPVEKVEIRDVSGAGDSFFAGLICDYIISEDIKSAIGWANQCASKVVQRRGVSTIC